MSDLKFPPKDLLQVLSGEELASKLKALIGKPFPLTDKPRTNGSTLRKMVTNVLDDGTVCVAEKNDFSIIPSKGKGVPKLLACLADTYIVTTGDNYNLQVWNRFPNTNNALVEYVQTNQRITCKDIRFILVQIDIQSKTIKNIVVATPQYIEEKFGVFGVPTIKHQLIISDLKRREIIDSKDQYVFFDDTEKVSKLTAQGPINIKDNIADAPKSGALLSLKQIRDKVMPALIGIQLANVDTKTRGQLLERTVANILGYDVDENLVGGYPDIPNQALEVKVQDSPTVDLGKYSPGCPVVVNDELSLTTEDIRYLIALTDKEGIIEGVILCPGYKLGDMFVFVNDTSYKCQRSIPMEFFDGFHRKSLFNP